MGQSSPDTRYHDTMTIKPTEPFLKTESKRPTWRHTVTMLSIETGAHTIDAIYQETGIERGTLAQILDHLESQFYITRVNGRYHRPTAKHAIVPTCGV